MADDGGGGGGVPEWVVTFGDMMSLLLTFFIMLVSFSEMKSEEKYQALMDAFQQQFGYHQSKTSVIPGEVRARSSTLSKIASLGRARRTDTMRGGAKIQAPVGDNNQVTSIRTGKKTAIGTVLYFQEDQVELDESQRLALQQQVEQLQGKPQKIEVRGHTSNRPPDATARLRDNWDLSFERCRRVVDHLTKELKIDPRRIRMSEAGANEPLHIGTDASKLQRNPRVEIYLLDELMTDTVGTEQEQRGRLVDSPATPGTAAPPKP